MAIYKLHLLPMKTLLMALLFFALAACKTDTKKNNDLVAPTEQLHLEYAEGFSVDYFETHKVLTITKPWPKSEKTYRYLLISKESMAKTTFAKDAFDGIIVNPVNTIVVTSTTHIPALELLNVEASLIGFPGLDYISSERTRKNITDGKIRELGKNEGLNTEVLLELHPDVLVGFGVDGVNQTFEVVKKSGIPVIYNGDWVERSVLAKAEWIKFFGVLFNKEKKADSIFNSIKNEYSEAKLIAQNATHRPSVLSGAMHKDAWYLPNGTSPEAQFLKDANVNYLWSETTGNGSLALSFETVLEKAKHAELWINPSYYGDLEQLQKGNPLYAHFEAYKKKNIYTFANKKGATGGVLYYELGTARPDLVLKDLIKIAHPELLGDYDPYFFEKLK